VSWEPPFCAGPLFVAGETKDYVYPNQRASTSWYHDHALHITLDNAYHGLAGMYIMSDKIKNGGCGEPYNLEVRGWAWCDT
jgi:FtsP/CotA-like multicopper oxidase with cupredoxin domain